MTKFLFIANKLGTRVPDLWDAEFKSVKEAKLLIEEFAYVSGEKLIREWYFDKSISCHILDTDKATYLIQDLQAEEGGDE